MNAYEIVEKTFSGNDGLVCREWRKLETKVDGTDLFITIELKSNEALRSIFISEASSFESWSIKTDDYYRERTPSKAIDTYMRLFEPSRRLELYEQILEFDHRPLFLVDPRFDQERFSYETCKENPILMADITPFLSERIRHYSQNIFKQLKGRVEIRVHEARYETLPNIYIQIVSTNNKV